jgi:hypothetical protein
MYDAYLYMYMYMYVYAYIRRIFGKSQCLSICMHMILARLSTTCRDLSISLLTYKNACTDTYVHIETYMHTYAHTNMHACKRAYTPNIGIDIHETYMHMHT